MSKSAKSTEGREAASAGQPAFRGGGTKFSR
jgi:hypothetical protein